MYERMLQKEVKPSLNDIYNITGYKKSHYNKKETRKVEGKQAMNLMPAKSTLLQYKNKAKCFVYIFPDSSIMRRKGAFVGIGNCPIDSSALPLPRE